MNNKEIIIFIESWAPKGAAWAKDNVGLQIGSLSDKTNNVLLCLDITIEKLLEAKKKNCNLILSHHPLFFNPIKKINTDDQEKGEIISFAIKNNLTIASFHTNLDFTKDGVSFALAQKLKLKNIDFLMPLTDSQNKLVVFVPVESIEKVSNSLFEAGAGRIGNYEQCSYRIEGEGTFRGNEFSNPTAGTKNNFEKVKEIRLEVIFNKWDKEKIISALMKSHPYEEPAFDIYPIENQNRNFGMGAKGELIESMNEENFLNHVSLNLKLNGLRYSSGKKKLIKKVAVCGGSGSDMINQTIRENFDAFVTADIKYHQFLDAENKILLIDAGHFETEIIILKELKKRIEKFISDSKEKNMVFISSMEKSPIRYFNNIKGVK